MSTNISDQIGHARRDLLDLTARNRLLNTPLNRQRSSRLDLHDELTDELFRLLVRERREMSFLPAPEADADAAAAEEVNVEEAGDDEVDTSADVAVDREDEDSDEDGSSDSAVEQPLSLAQPNEDTPSEDTPKENTTNEPVPGPAERHVDRNLQTDIDDEKLQGRLLRLFYDARTSQEEQGVNSLYLAMGFLEWCEPDAKDKPRFAPLLLIPVELHRRSVNAKFRLKVLDDEISTNLSLKEKLKVEFSLQLPEVPDTDDLTPADYFAAVETVIAEQSNWRLHHDRQTLWFFSFSKFLMFRDLNPDVWPDQSGPTHHRLLRGLLGEPIEFEPPMIGEDDNLDERLTPQSLTHVMDADGSQAAAIEEVRLGRNLVIQGPPGTGKSQSITNLISTAVTDGKTVLFVSEKLAALEVVKSRLDCIGLGDMCLELHSHKANRKAVLENLSDVLELGRPVALNVDERAERLTRTRDQLNAYVDQLHEPLSPQDRTPYELSGTFLRLLANQTQPFHAEFPDIADWSTSDLKQHQRTLADIAQHIEQLGRPSEHVWFGVQRSTPLLPTDINALRTRLKDIHVQFERTIDVAKKLFESLNVEWTCSESFARIGQIFALGRLMQTSPRLDRTAFGNDVWAEQRDDIKKAMTVVRKYGEYREWLDQHLAPVAWQADVRQARIDLAATGRSWFRWFNSNWRAARRTLLGISNQPLPKSLDEQLKLLDGLMAAQDLAKQLNEGRVAELGRSAFGSAWSGSDSDWNQLCELYDWEDQCARSNDPVDFHRIVASDVDESARDEALDQLSEVADTLTTDVHDVLSDLSFDATLAFDIKDEAPPHEQLPNCFCRPWDDTDWRFQRVAVETLQERVIQWSEATDQLGRWLMFQRRLRDLAETSLAFLLPEILRSVTDDLAPDRLTYAVCEAGMRRVLTERDAIAEFDGVKQTRRVHEFRRLDHERIRMARHEVASAHYARIPTGGNHGQLGVIRTEIRKKRRHKQIRRLLNEAGHAVQALKPVFMMSPLSIAQFLEPGALNFDLLVIDEASQVRPVEAFGAVMRCQQMVVVGDNRQLPPTAFFDHLSGADDTDDDTTQAGDVESILDLCDARGFPQRMLRWHYRSRHHSLISVSNHEFYDNRLFVIPSPEGNASERGLKFQFVEDGVFDRGGTRTNQTEARTVAQAMIQHARQSPNLTLGVGTFSVSQRDAILNELERLRRENADAESFFASNEGEPWFVKNLENIQGDERDVILISVGYGPDQNGKTSMNFGPLNRDGGERRLNVLITRSRERCVVYSSLRADQIDLSRTSARGVASLRTFLQFAESDGDDAINRQDATGVLDFESHIANELTSAGWQVEHQVGTPQFHVDVAVVDPDCPGSYLLGIECDGRSYRSARWARDRDRLQQSVLERHGWALHRAWSTDWFHSRASELQKLLNRLNDVHAARSQQDEDESTGDPDLVEADPVVLEFEEDAIDDGQNSDEAPNEDAIISREPVAGEDDEDASDSISYQEADFKHDLMDRPIQDVKPADLAPVIQRILEIEGPVHSAEIERRAVDLWQLSRTGRRIKDAVMKSCHWLTRQGIAVDEDDVYWLASQTEFPVRDRSNVSSATLRKPDMLPRAELRTGVEAFVRNHVAVTRDEAARGVARMLGFRSTSPQVREVIDGVIDDLVTESSLSEHGGQLHARS